MSEEVSADCWSCDVEFTVEVDGGEPQVKDDETCENRCPSCGEEQDLNLEYSVSHVYTSPVPGSPRKEPGVCLTTGQPESCTCCPHRSVSGPRTTGGESS